MKNKFILLCLTICLLYGQAFAQAKLSPADIGGKAYLLMEADSEIVLAQYRATERLAPASITKLMTAYVVYQSLAAGIIALDDFAIISSNARNMTEGSRMFLEKGSHVSIDDLLSGLVIQSGNDAAVALAEAVAGDEARFVDIMNRQAQALGMTNSHFKNVTGLTEDGHYMSARDIATLAAAIIKDFPKHYQRYSKKSFTWNNITQDNRNALLYRDASVDGLKTGYTAAAGYCLTASARRGDMRLISVVLGTDSVGARARASKKLLAYGFDNYQMTTVYQPGQQVALATVDNGEQDSVAVASSVAITLPLPKTNSAQGLKAQLHLKQQLTAPLAANQVVGDIRLQRGDKILVSAPAVTINAVEEIGFFSRLWRDLWAMITGWFA